jgi:hypothetical protein
LMDCLPVKVLRPPAADHHIMRRRQCGTVDFEYL